MEGYQTLILLRHESAIKIHNSIIWPIQTAGQNQHSPKSSLILIHLIYPLVFGCLAFPICLRLGLFNSPPITLHFRQIFNPVLFLAILLHSEHVTRFI